MKTYELLEDPKSWTQRDSAIDAIGLPVSVQDPSACSFCIIGALYRCYPDASKDEMGSKMSRIQDQIRALDPLNRPVYSIPEWNDSPKRTHAEVIAVLKAANV
jgi:hypothetical protein